MSDASMNVVMVCARYPPLTGGTEVHVAEVGRRLAARGHAVTVITTVLEPDQAGEDDDGGVRVIRLRAYPRDWDLYFAPAIRRRLELRRADVVHVQGYHTMVAPLAMHGAVAAGRPFVVSFHSGGHSSRVRRRIRPTHQRALRWWLRRADRLIGVSEYETEHFRRRLGLPPERFTTITNGVADEFFAVEPSSARAGDDRRRVIASIGRLEEYKGHQHVIDALARVRRYVPDARLQVVGDGPYRQSLIDLAARRGLAGQVEFVSVPYSDRRAMAQLMADASVVALASRYESQGIVGLEAVAAGTRLVVLGGSALADLATYDGVEVVATADVDVLAPVLVRQLERPPLAARSRPATWDDTTSMLEDVYRSAVRGDPAGGRSIRS